MKPRVGRKQVDGKSSIRKGDTTQGKAKRRTQTQAITKQLKRFIRRWKATKKEGRRKKHNSTNKGK
jgi:hypothetical protein